MESQPHRKYNIFASTAVLSAILAIFSISVFTVINLTAAYESNKDSSNVLGVETKLTITDLNGDGLKYKDISNFTEPVSNVEVAKSPDRIKISLKDHPANQYFYEFFRVQNTSDFEKAFALKGITNSLPDSSKVYIIIDSQKFDFALETPKLVLKPGKSLTVGFFVDSAENVNYSSEIEILLKN